MSTLLLIALVLLAGVLTAVQAPTNAFLARAVGSPVNAALVSFLVGTGVLAVIAAASGARPDWPAVRVLPWWALMGGAYGALFVAIAAYGAPRLGVGLLLTLSVAAQLIAAVVLDSIGAFGLPPKPLNLERVAGVALVIAGVLLVRRSA